MMVSRGGAFGILIGAVVGTLFLVPAHGSAQDSLSVSWVKSRFCEKAEEAPRLRLGCLGDLLFLEE